MVSSPPFSFCCSFSFLSPCPPFLVLSLSLSLLPPRVWLDWTGHGDGERWDDIRLRECKLQCKTRPLHWATKTTWRPRDLLRATRQCRRAGGQCGHVAARTGYAIIKKTKKTKMARVVCVHCRASLCMCSLQIQAQTFPTRAARARSFPSMPGTRIRWSAPRVFFAILQSIHHVLSLLLRGAGDDDQRRHDMPTRVRA